jgi:hypothetical protein
MFRLGAESYSLRTQFPWSRSQIIQSSKRAWDLCMIVTVFMTGHSFSYITTPIICRRVPWFRRNILPCIRNCYNSHVIIQIHHHHHHHWHDSPLWALAFFRISEQFNFYGVRLSASRPTSNLEDQGITLRLVPPPRPVLPGWPYQ